MAASQTDLDTSEFSHSALDTFMASIHISSTPSLEASADEDKFFSFCSTIKKYSKYDNESDNAKEQNDAAQNIKETPKRFVGITRKQKLFESTEDAEEFKPRSRSSLNRRDLSPQSLLLKKAITRFECMQRRQERMALCKKPMRTSLRV